MISSLIIAWILTWFNLDNVIVNAINEICKTNYTTAIYWFLFFIVGILICMFKK